MTKNRSGKQGPEMRQTRKGRRWHFGMKMQTGADAEAGVAHSFAEGHESHMVHRHRLLHGGERRA